MASALGSCIFRNGTSKWFPRYSGLSTMTCRHLCIPAARPSVQPVYRVIAAHGRASSYSGITQPLLHRQLACVQLGYNHGQFRSFTEDRKTTALTLIRDLKHLKSTPPAALVLGLGGVIPFAAMPAYMIMSGSFVASLAFCQVAYGACILSFLGGIRWGLTIPEDSGVQPNWFNLGCSVTPSLIAWVGLLMPTSLALLTLITGLTGSAFMDLSMWGYPPWFRALRFLLSVLAILSLWTTLMCQIILSETKASKSDKKDKKDKQKTVTGKAGQDSKSVEVSAIDKVVAVQSPPVAKETAMIVDTVAEPDTDSNAATNTSKQLAVAKIDEEVKEIKD